KGVKFRKRRHGGRRDEAIEDHRHALLARRKRGAENRRQLMPAERRREGERIVHQRGMSRERLIDDRALARKASIVDPGAAPCPARAATTKKTSSNSGRSRRV